MKILIKFENLIIESVSSFDEENEKLFQTVENLGAVYNDIKVESFTEVKKCYNEWTDENYVIEFEMKNLTYVYEITKENLPKVKTFLDFCLELDYQFEYEIHE